MMYLILLTYLTYLTNLTILILLNCILKHLILPNIYAHTRNYLMDAQERKVVTAIGDFQ